jgi:hypothetical protein
MNLAASRSVRPGVIVRTCSVIASRTFTRASLRRSDLPRHRPRARAGAKILRRAALAQVPAMSDATGAILLRPAGPADIPVVLELWARACSLHASTPDTRETAGAVRRNRPRRAARGDDGGPAGAETIARFVRNL